MGIWTQMCPPKPAFTEQNLGNLTGKVCKLDTPW